MSNAAEHAHSGSGYERREASVRLILFSIAGLAVTVVIVCGIVYGLFKWFEGQYTAEGRDTQVATSLPSTPGPHVEEFPATELKEMRGNEEAILHSYGYVDQKSGVVHIPIEKAMDDVLATLPTGPAKGAPNNAAKPPQGGTRANPQ